MTQSSLPTRLKKEPLIDAVFEMRVEAAAPLTSLLPGLLRAQLSGGEALVPARTQLAAIPDELRNADPQLRYAALLTMDWGAFRILVGDRMVAVGSKLPYPGWGKFRDAIRELMRILTESKLVTSIERYSVKYVDFIEAASLEQQVKTLNWSVNIGGRSLQSEVATVKSEFAIDGFQTIITVQTGAVANLRGVSGAKGLVLDVDSIFNAEGLSPNAFFAEIDERINRIHASNKQIFFDCLTPATLDLLEPEYGG